MLCKKHKEWEQLNGEDGKIGDYEILICSILDNGSISFTEPTSNWTPINVGDCAGSPDCLLGIWGKFSESADGDLYTCGWTQISPGVELSVIRYSGVSVEDPIIASECNTGSSSVAIAPGVPAEENSAVIRIYTGTQGLPPFVTPPPIVGPLPPNFDRASLLIAQSLGGGPEPEIRLFLFGNGNTVAESGSVSPENLILNESSPWTACTITLRMDPSTNPPSSLASVPTLNIIGLVIVPILLLFIALVKLRRSANK